MKQVTSSSKRKTNIAADVKKAASRADGLVRSIRAAHSAACESNPLLAMVLLGRIESALTLQRKLREIETCLKA